MTEKQIAAIVVVGDCRERAQRVLDSLSRQTIADAMELVIVDLATWEAPRLVTPVGIPTTYVCHKNESWAHARAEAVHLASAPIVAFIEDHCTAATGWAEALVRAYAGPWAAVGYTFSCPKKESYFARAALMAENGMWIAPVASHPAQLVSSGNVSYPRALLLSLGDELEALLTPDFGAQERFKSQGFELYVEAGAAVAHESFERIDSILAASFVYCRLLAAKRARTQAWGAFKRMLLGFGTLAVSPLFSIGRLVMSLRGRRLLWWSFIASLPIVLLKAIASALGESTGYIFGGADKEQEFDRWELHLERIKQ